MARITATITPVHADESACTHKPRETGCAGRSAYLVTCSACTWTDTSTTQAELADARDRHLRSHLTQPAPVSA
ncbi:hypothetical protein [Streptomyces sp. NBC_01361]|uniref:hypothetical protein n=1 Tax=Streptomyces sp. NBC_01361 TaxID=2903838 RepID=UPI002E2F8CCE|nr:hypothetical protein [Streptomyces sp. NBC_01361]